MKRIVILVIFLAGCGNHTAPRTSPNRPGGAIGEASGERDADLDGLVDGAFYVAGNFLGRSAATGPWWPTRPAKSTVLHNYTRALSIL